MVYSARLKNCLSLFPVIFFTHKSYLYKFWLFNYQQVITKKEQTLRFVDTQISPKQKPEIK